MDKKTCRLERFSNFSIGITLLLVGLLFGIVSMAIIPVVGLLIAIPVAILGVGRLVEGKSKACAMIAERTKKMTTF